MDRSSRHTYRTFDNLDILFFRLYIRLFESLRSITFVGSYKTCTQLNSRSTQIHNTLDVFSCINTSSRNHRNLFTIHLFETGNLLDHLWQQFFQCIMLVCQLVLFIPQMTTRFRAFQYHSIRQIVIMTLPLFTDDANCTCTRNDRYQFRHTIFLQERGQIQWQTCATENHIHLLGDTGLDQLCEIRKSHHHIHTDNALCLLTGLADFLFQSQITRFRIIVRTQFLIQQTQSCCRNNANTTFICYGRCQAREGDTYTHSTLNDGNTCF